MKNYLSVFYNLKEKPYTSYPSKFVKYNIERFKLHNSNFLEIGCGRGDFINEFNKCEMNCFATDALENAETYLDKGITFKQNNISLNPLPFDDNFFDVIFTKSVIEHIDKHEFFFKECKRVLKKGGILITYTPDWESQYLHFYDDITHIKPFTKISLENCYKIFGFEKCKVEKFYQLPIVWSFPFLKPILKLLSLIIPIRSKIKFLKFAKELMLLGYARKS